ncbi:MAG: hypothetical protein JSR77_09940 [Planctomycetes bacterium]|nr:hypothetical protein [Planctomycetota bacterium]
MTTQSHALAVCGLLASFASAQPCEPPNPPSNIFVPTVVGCWPRIFYAYPVGATHVQLYRGRTPDFTSAAFVQRHNGFGIVFDDYSAPIGVQLHYWLFSGNDCAEGAPQGPFPLWRDLRPPPIENLRVTSISCRGVVLSWDPPPDWALSPAVRIWRTDVPQFFSVDLIAQLWDRNRGWCLDPGQPGRPRWYWVERMEDSCPSVVVGPVSASVPAQIEAPQVWAPTPPLCRRIQLQLSDQCATSFTLYRNREPGDDTLIELATVDAPDAATYTDSAVLPGVPYAYRAIAHWRGADSPLSEPLVAIAGDSPPTFVPATDRRVQYGDTLVLTAPLSDAQFYETFTYRWRKDGVDLVNFSGGWGASQKTLYVYDCDDGDAGTYDVRVSNACGTAISPPIRVEVGLFTRCSYCLADYNNDGGVDGADVDEFLSDWSRSMPCADVNRDGGVDGADVGAWFGLWSAGTC